MVEKIKKLSKKKKIISLIIMLIIFLVIFSCEVYFLYLKDNKGKQNVKENKKKSETIEKEVVNTFEHNKDILSYNIVKDSISVKEDNNPIILFGSDYQGENRYNSFQSIIEKIDIIPNLFIFDGDYQVFLDNNFYYSEQGIVEMYNIFHNKFSNDIQTMLIQGNHDPKDTYGLVNTGMYTSGKYNVYALNEDSYPSSQKGEFDKEEQIKEISSKLNDDLTKLVNENNKKPIFIVSHVPLHYSNRDDGLDNAYSKYIVDVLNNYGNTLNIIFLFAHNHSGNYDDYIGGSVNYLAKGSTMKVTENQIDEKINFTYLNAGYVGYANNSINDKTTNIPSMTTIKINDNNIEIQKYTKYGIYYNNPIVVNLIK